MIAQISLGAVPSPGALLGTTGHADLISSINRHMGMGSEFFGSVNDIFARGRQTFVQNIIEPIRQASFSIKSTANKLIRNDVYVSIKPTQEDFEWVPPCMQMPILLYQPIRDLHSQGRIDGFGFDPAHLPEEDCYGRLIGNGTIDDVKSAMDDNGVVTFEYEWHSSDPDLTFDEMDHIEFTRRSLDYILKHESWDPTNPNENRG